MISCDYQTFSHGETTMQVHKACCWIFTPNSGHCIVTDGHICKPDNGPACADTSSYLPAFPTVKVILKNLYILCIQI